MGNVQVGDVVVVEQRGKMYHAIVVNKGFNHKPLIVKNQNLRKGEFIPVWIRCDDIVEIITHIDLVDLLNRALDDTALILE